MSADNPFPDGSRVLTRYPAPGQPESDPREAWPWWPGEVDERLGPEWVITLCARELAELEDGSPAYPQCFRGASEIRPAAGFTVGVQQQFNSCDLVTLNSDGSHPDE